MAHTEARTDTTVLPETTPPSAQMPHPVRVAHVVGKVVLGGVDQVVMNYYRHVDRRKVQFDFFMDGLSDTPIDHEIRSMGGRIYKLPTYEGSMLNNLTEFRRHLRANQYPIMHCHMNTLSGFWLREAKRAGVPVRIAHSHSTAARGERKRALMKYALRPLASLYANEYMACTEHAGRWLFGDQRFDSGEVRLIKNALAIDEFRSNGDIRNQARSELGVSDNFVVGHVGRFEYQKNHRFLIEVFEQVERLRPNAVLLLIGEGALRQDMEDLCRRKGIAGKVIFAGTRTDVARLLQVMDCFVFPSHFEGLGLAVVEAQAAGVPCLVSTAVPREAAISSKYSALSTDSAPEVWAKAITNFAPIGDGVANASESVRNAGYCIDEAAKHLAKLYITLISHHRNSDEVEGPAERRRSALVERATAR